MTTPLLAKVLSIAMDLQTSYPPYVPFALGAVVGSALGLFLGAILTLWLGDKQLVHRLLDKLSGGNNQPSFELLLQ